MSALLLMMHLIWSIIICIIKISTFSELCIFSGVLWSICNKGDPYFKYNSKQKENLKNKLQSHFNAISINSLMCIVSFLSFFPLMKSYYIFFNWLILKRGRRMGRERHRFIVPLNYAFVTCFLYVSWQGLNPQPWCISTML